MWLYRVILAVGGILTARSFIGLKVAWASSWKYVHDIMVYCLYAIKKHYIRADIHYCIFHSKFSLPHFAHSKRLNVLNILSIFDDFSIYGIYLLMASTIVSWGPTQHLKEFSRL